MTRICKKNLRRLEKGLPIVPSEDEEGYILANWLTLSGLSFAHIANERKTTPQRGAKLKKLGVSKGVPDYVIVIPSKKPLGENRLVFIELKRAVKSFSAVTPEQHAWNVILNNCRGTAAFICYGAEEAIEVISRILPERFRKVS